jgi:glycosidase
MHSLYRRLLELRHEREVLRRGSIEFEPADGDVIRFERALDDARMTVLVNLGDKDAPWPDDLGTATVVLSTTPDRINAGGELAPDEATVLHP